jgi:hypothetical protein
VVCVCVCVYLCVCICVCVCVCVSVCVFSTCLWCLEHQSYAHYRLNYSCEVDRVVMSVGGTSVGTVVLWWCTYGEISLHIFYFLFISPLFHQVGKLRTSSHLQL